MQSQKGSTLPHSVYNFSSNSTTYRRTAFPAFSNQAMDTPVKEGFLQKAHPKDGIFSVTIWQKRYFVLWGTGTVEYYTNYNKKADEYCGTLNMVDCEDMVAPITVGKRHNVIKLTMKQKDKLKDYWLDCECPPLMNEWVQLLANASGLVPEENEQNLSLTESMAHASLLERPLPPTPVKSDADYEIPTRCGSTDSDQPSVEENYEEIGSTSSADSVNDWEAFVPPKRYSKAASLHRYSQNVQETIAKQDLLKKSALPSNQTTPRKSPTPSSFSPPLGTGVPVLGPVPARRPPKLNPFVDATASELRERLSQRREEGSATAESLSPTEVYEEVQVSNEVKVGRPASQHRINYKKDSDDDVQLPAYLSVENEAEENSLRTPVPTLPPRDKKQVSPPFTSSSHVLSSSAPSLPPRSHPSQESSNPRAHPVLAVSTHGERKSLPPTPALREVKETLPPPLPHRNHSLDVTSLVTGTSDNESDSPPPVPQRRAVGGGGGGGGGRLTPTDNAKPKPAQRRAHPRTPPKNASLSNQTESSLDKSPRDGAVGRQPPAGNPLHGSAQSVTSSLPSTHAPSPHSVTSSLPPSAHTPSSRKSPLPNPPPGVQSDVGSPSMVRPGKGATNSNKPKPRPPTKQKPKFEAQQIMGGITSKPSPPTPTKRTNREVASGTRGDTPTPPPPTSTSSPLIEELNRSQQNRLNVQKMHLGLSDSAVSPTSTSSPSSPSSSTSSPMSRRPPAILPKPGQNKQVSQPVFACRPLNEPEMMTVNHKSPLSQAARSTKPLVNGQSSHEIPVNHHSNATSNNVRPPVRSKKPPMPPPKPR